MASNYTYASPSTGLDNAMASKLLHAITNYTSVVSFDQWNDTISTTPYVRHIVSTAEAILMDNGTDDANTSCRSSTPCTGDLARLMCLNGGTCCWSERLGHALCQCIRGYTGRRCHAIADYDDDDIADSRGKWQMITTTSMISLLVGLVALIAFIVLIVLIMRKKLSLRKNMFGIEDNVTQIEKEINRMPTVSKLVHLTRLTKKFEESARATADEVMQAAAIIEGLEESGNLHLLSDTARSYLPRWSSAPSCLQSIESEDVPDGLVTPLVPAGGGKRRTMFPMISMKRSRDQRKLQQMMSNPI